jgi:hypothetical protein
MDEKRTHFKKKASGQRVYYLHFDGHGDERGLRLRKERGLRRSYSNS